MKSCQQCEARTLSPLQALTTQEIVQVQRHRLFQNFKKGDVIFDEGNALNGVYCIRSGVCKLMKLSDNGRHQIIKLATSGDIIGQRSLVCDERTNLKAIALNTVSACFIPKSQFKDWLTSNSKLSFCMLKFVASDLKKADDDIIKMAQKSVKQRLADFLLYNQSRFGVDTLGFLNVNFSRKDYANLVGTTTESTIRLLSDFNKIGFIEIKGKQIKILKPELLKKL